MGGLGPNDTKAVKVRLLYIARNAQSAIGNSGLLAGTLALLAVGKPAQ